MPTRGRHVANATLTGMTIVAEGSKFALAARKGEADPRDHWAVDEDTGICVRIHQKLGTNLYGPYHVGESRAMPRLSSWLKKHTASSLGGLEKPVESWIGATTFQLKPKCMKAKFSNRPEVIDRILEGEGWSFIKPKRLHEFKYPKDEDCPKPDPNDINDALESALLLQA